MVTIQFIFKERDDAIRVHQNISTCLTNSNSIIGPPRYSPNTKNYVIPLTISDKEDDEKRYTIHIPWSGVSSSILRLQPKTKPSKKKGHKHV